MKIEKKISKSCSVSAKITDAQNAKLVALAKKHSITKSNLISQLLEAGYLNITKAKTF